MLSHNDIMEELSLAYVRAVASRAGFAVEEVRRDRDSIDLHIHGRGVVDDGALHAPALAVQLKSTARDIPDDCDVLDYDLKVKNYNDLAHPRRMIPCVLVLFLLPEDPARWVTWTEESLVLRRSAYWLSLCGSPVTPNRSSARVRVPRAQVFDSVSIRDLLGRIAREEALAC